MARLHVIQKACKHQYNSQLCSLSELLNIIVTFIIHLRIKSRPDQTSIEDPQDIYLRRVVFFMLQEGSKSTSLIDLCFGSKYY